MRERITVLEASSRHMTEQVEDIHKKVEEMHEVLLKAKGAKWVIVGSAGIIGFLASLVTHIPSWWGK